ncbi:hypothetical protein ACFSNO_18595 [Streptomyces cirratus]
MARPLKMLTTAAMTATSTAVKRLPVPSSVTTDFLAGVRRCPARGAGIRRSPLPCAGSVTAPTTAPASPVPSKP